MTIFVAMVEVSIIIVCMNRPDNLYPCLESIMLNTGVQYETIVVAYMYSQEGLQKAREDFPWVKFIVNDSIRGFSENNNLALEQARGRFCFILNDDTEVSEGAVDKLVADFEGLPEKTAIVTPKLLNADGTLQLCGRPEYPAVNYVLQQWHLFKEPVDNTIGRDPDFTIDGRRIFRTFNISGAAFMIRTDVFEELGWFDERFFFTPEDIALSTSARKKGYSVFVDADTEITHKWRTTASKIMSAVRPAAVRGSLIHFSGSNNLRYIAIAVPVWCAEFAKRLKAAYVCAMVPSIENHSKLMTFRNITRSIFTHDSPKRIFTKYYDILKKLQGNG